MGKVSGKDAERSVDAFDTAGLLRRHKRFGVEAASAFEGASPHLSGQVLGHSELFNIL